MPNYNQTLQTNNSSLEEIINQLNNMPDADDYLTEDCVEYKFHLHAGGEYGMSTVFTSPAGTEVDPTEPWLLAKEDFETGEDGAMEFIYRSYFGNLVNDLQTPYRYATISLEGEAPYHLRLDGPYERQFINGYSTSGDFMALFAGREENCLKIEQGSGVGSLSEAPYHWYFCPSESFATLIRDISDGIGYIADMDLDIVIRIYKA